ncbi:IS110 family transposase, partial [Chloroflexi bacterium TSY]|nr:IS110 family transposase [Chloroflexi bacterium TSY]MBV7338888.1 IS110 family transposase [Chloroflexi bacterium TSY]
FIGIDWSETKHDVMITDENGRRINYMTIEHSVDGFKQLEKWRETMDIGHENVESD